MSSQKLRYRKEEFAKRGTALYEETVRSQVESDNYGKIVAIDIETGDYAVADNSLNDSAKLREHRPCAQAWFVRIKYETVHRIGSTNDTVAE